MANKNETQLPVPEVTSAQAPPMTVENLLAHVRLVKGVMEQVMVKDKHYGVIEGTEKPTLYKPGAELLCLTFRLGPRYEIVNRSEFPMGFEVRCELHSITTGNLIAEGMGSCNQHETKYRYRSENTNREVPGKYWKTRDPMLLGGREFKARKKGKKWFIYQTVENEDPRDLDNTILKMACKRALVAATLNAVAASEIFTQDLEDFVKKDEEPAPPPEEKAGAETPPPPGDPDPAEPEQPNHAEPGEEPNNDAYPYLRKLLMEKVTGINTHPAAKAWIPKDMTGKQANEIIELLKGIKGPQIDQGKLLEFYKKAGVKIR